MIQYHVKLLLIGQPQAIEFNMQCDNSMVATGRVCQWAADFFGKDAIIHRLDVKPLKGTPIKDLLPNEPQAGDRE